MPYTFEQCAYASRLFHNRIIHLQRVFEWKAKREALLTLVDDVPHLADAHMKRSIQSHPTNAHALFVDTRPTIRLAIACEAMANTLYSCADIAANFANKVSDGLLPATFNRLRGQIEKGNFTEVASHLGDLQWYRKVRELRTELAHFSSIFIAGAFDQPPILCFRAYRDPNDKREFPRKVQCSVGELLAWTSNAIKTLDAFAAYLIASFVIPKFELDMTIKLPRVDQFGFPIILNNGILEMEQMTVREYLRRGGFNI